MTEWTTLVDAETLASHLHRSDLRIFDCRFTLNDTAAGERAWRQAHIPGARHAHLDRDLSGAHVPGAGRHPWPSAADFGDWLGRNGVAPTTQVVAYDAGDGAFAARLWWLLRVAGHAQAAVLDGGFARWTALALPTDDDIAPVEPATCPVVFDTSRLLDADAVAARVSAGGLLLDARGAERFRGEVEPIDRVAGHVPGALNRPYPSNLEDGRFKPATRLAEEFGTLLAGRPASDLIAMCGSGVTACHHLLAMAHAGLPGASLFTGSWSGWIEDPARAIATGSD